MSELDVLRADVIKRLSEDLLHTKDVDVVLDALVGVVRADERERCAKELEERADLLCKENCYCEECATWRDAAVRLRGLK